jgi:AcrR family transcriptional regulator
MRLIMDEAGVNVASIHYHFGDRERLLEQVIQRRAIVINRERISLLDRAIKSDANDVDGILRALVQPAITLAMGKERGWMHYFRLLGRLEANAEDLYGAIMSNYYNRTHLSFIDALSKALPGIPRNTMVWRYYFVVAVMSRASTSLEPVRKWSGRKINPKIASDVLKELIPALSSIVVGPHPNGFR